MEEEFSLNRVKSLLFEMCKEALMEDTVVPSATFYCRAPKGKTINECATTITLNHKASDLLKTLIEELWGNREPHLTISKKELEEEVVNTLFEGTQDLVENKFDIDHVLRSLFSRIKENNLTWDIYLPVFGLRLPEGSLLELAGGTFQEMSDTEKAKRTEECNDIWCKASLNTLKETQSKIDPLSEELSKTLSCSKVWFHIQVFGRAHFAENQAVETATLAVDILCFFAVLNGINPETTILGCPKKVEIGETRSLQIASGHSCNMNAGIDRFESYRLDKRKYENLINLPEFQILQHISKKAEPNEAEQKCLLGIQQFAEASRLPSMSLRLVWYLSSLETVLVKESEGNRHKKVGLRIRNILGNKAADMIEPLYEKRRKPVHYGYRNKNEVELITETDVHLALNIAYLGIVSVLKLLDESLTHDQFLDVLDTMPEQFR